MKGSAEENKPENLDEDTDYWNVPFFELEKDRSMTGWVCSVPRIRSMISSYYADTNGYEI